MFLTFCLYGLKFQNVLTVFIFSLSRVVPQEFKQNDICTQKKVQYFKFVKLRMF